MRVLTTIDGQSRAEAFVAYLITQNISTHVEPASDGDGRWEIWIRDEDKIDNAQAELRSFLENPDDIRYLQAVKDARTILLEKRQLAERRRGNVRTVRDIAQNSMFGGRLPPLTLTLIILCSVLGILSNFSRPGATNRLGNIIVHQLMFVDFAKYQMTGDPAQSIKEYQLWRIVTPAFLHGSMMHLVMNMLSLAMLGRIQERLEGTARYAWLLVLFAVGSHLLQGLLPRDVLGIEGLSGSPNFVGISGVILGIFGYLAVKTNLRHDLGFFLSPQLYVMVALVLIIGFMGDLTGSSQSQPLANLAHLGGLVTGMLAGWILSNPRFDVKKR